MTHSIRVYIAKTEHLETGTRHLEHAQVVALEHGFSLLPVTDELYEEVCPQGQNRNERSESYEEFYELNPELERLGLALSEEGAVAYVETDYHGGVGEQASILWKHCETLIDPSCGFMGPINRVLAQMGIEATDDHDEFEELGLYRYRDNDKWIEQPTYGQQTEHTTNLPREDLLSEILRRLRRRFFWR